MGTKLKPGKFDCLKNAKKDEPYFVLLARDETSAMLVRCWAYGRKARITRGEKPKSDQSMIEEALVCANDMDAWRKKNHPSVRDKKEAKEAAEHAAKVVIYKKTGVWPEKATYKKPIPKKMKGKRK
jgi:hypothetical protein